MLKQTHRKHILKELLSGTKLSSLNPEINQYIAVAAPILSLLLHTPKPAYIQIVKPDTQIASIWDIEDVLTERPDLNDKQARAILTQIEKTFDANDGICWDTIRIAATSLFGEAPEECD